MPNFSKIILLIFIVFFYTIFCSAQQVETGAEFERQAIEMLKKDKMKALSLYSKSAFAYWNENNTRDAIKIFCRINKINKENDSKPGVLRTEINLGKLYVDEHKYDSAIYYFNDALIISKQLDQTVDIATCLLNIASSYQATKDFDKSFKFIEDAMVIALEQENLYFVKQAYGMYAHYYESKNIPDKSFEFFEKYAAIDKKIKEKDMYELKKASEKEVMIANQQKIVSEFQLTKANLEIKEKEIMISEAQRQAKEREMKLKLSNLEIREKENQIIYERKIRRTLISAVAVAVFLLLFVFVLFIRNIKINRLLRKKNIEIEAQKQEIDSKNVKLNIQNKKITDSITYAKTIQNAILLQAKKVDDYFENFIVYLPKDIVSGDFYWFTPISKNECIIITADCTGHGVPGAFMSLIGNSILKEAINEHKIYDPATILITLNRRLNEVLRQDETESLDGMDLCVCHFLKSDNDSTIVTFSGAKRPIYYFKSSSGEFETHSGARFSTGGRYAHKTDVEYSNKSFIMEKNDILYMSSDGLIDQPTSGNKRFGTTKMLEMFKEISNLPMAEQADNILQIIKNYLINEEQRDDITIFAVRI